MAGILGLLGLTSTTNQPPAQSSIDTIVDRLPGTLNMGPLLDLAIPDLSCGQAHFQINTSGSPSFVIPCGQETLERLAGPFGQAVWQKLGVIQDTTLKADTAWAEAYARLERHQAAITLLREESASLKTAGQEAAVQGSPDAARLFAESRAKLLTAEDMESVSAVLGQDEARAKKAVVAKVTAAMQEECYKINAVASARCRESLQDVQGFLQRALACYMAASAVQRASDPGRIRDHLKYALPDRPLARDEQAPTDQPINLAPAET